jgi:hypothetical protein
MRAYLESYHLPSKLANARPADDEDRKNIADKKPKGSASAGGVLFAVHCASCHSNSKKQPAPGLREDIRRGLMAAWMTHQKKSETFLENNFLADEVRYPVYPRVGDCRPPLGTNMARALATNAIYGDVWEELSSREYKALRPPAPVTLHVPVFPADPRLPDLLKLPIRVDFEPPGGGRGYYRTPSLISMWATAPYLHNNSVGDYYVYVKQQDKDKEIKKRFWISTDGTMRRERRTDAWQQRPDPTVVDYYIDTSVAGRVEMFEDGMDKLLNPAKRHHWVKRTSHESILVPDLQNTVQQLIAGLAHEVILKEVRQELKERGVPPAQAEWLIQVVDGAVQRAIREAQKDAQASIRFAWAAVQVRARDHADRIFDLLFEDLRTELAQRKDVPIVIDGLRLPVRRAFLDRLDRLDKHFQESVLWKIPPGTPVNLYANLNASAIPYAVLAHIRYRDDPRALAEALLRLSDCPDLVEDSGHTYGSELSDKEKTDLIEFLKTL